MRANTQAIRASSAFSVVQLKGGTTCHLSFPSVRAAHEFCVKHARTENERQWIRSSWNGLDHQSTENFDRTGIAEKPRDLVQKAIAAMAVTPSKFGAIRPSMVGGSYSIPALMAGLPLSARNRIRNKLPPIDLRVAMMFSGNVDNAQVAPLSARIAKAIWDYVQAGGIVTLKVYNCVTIYGDKSNQPAFTEVTVNASDLASLSLALSPTFMRVVAAPILSALSNNSRDSLPIGQAPYADIHVIRGFSVGDLSKAVSKIEETLAIK